MANVADNYPAMDPDSCDAIGLAGLCNVQCHLFQDGKCRQRDVAENIIADLAQQYGYYPFQPGKANYDLIDIPAKPSKQYTDFDRAMDLVKR